MRLSKRVQRLVQKSARIIAKQAKMVQPRVSLKANPVKRQVFEMPQQDNSKLILLLLSPPDAEVALTLALTRNSQLRY